MGTFKRMKDMKDMTEAAPGMVAQAQQPGAQAQQMAAAHQGAYQARVMLASGVTGPSRSGSTGCAGRADHGRLRSPAWARPASPRACCRCCADPGRGSGAGHEPGTVAAAAASNQL